jgi:peptidoglycan hydrolase-like protein with peptidoglycan-binding domain
MQGRDDVEAAQRGLWRAADELGYTSTNARNGNYGEQTASDVEAFRQAVELPGSRDVIGASLWPAIHPYVDENGMVSFCNQPAAAPTPAPRPKLLPLKRGMTNPGVEACQRALWRALGDDSKSLRKGVYGDGTSADVTLFRERYKVNAGDSGESIGGELWNVLTRWMDAYAIELVHGWQPDAAPGPVANVMEQTLRTALGEVGYQEGAGNHTKYGAWYGLDHQPWCAMLVTWCACRHPTQSFAKASRYAYVPYVVADARAGRNGLKQVPAAQARRGMAVCFDWNDDGVADHIGLVVDPPESGSAFHTVEGNTSSGSAGSQSNGDGVYQRTRYVSDVICFASFS